MPSLSDLARVTESKAALKRRTRQPAQYDQLKTRTARRTPPGGHAVPEVDEQERASLELRAIIRTSFMRTPGLDIIGNSTRGGRNSRRGKVEAEAEFVSFIEQACLRKGNFHHFGLTKRLRKPVLHMYIQLVAEAAVGHTLPPIRVTKEMEALARLQLARLEQIIPDKYRHIIYEDRTKPRVIPRWLQRFMKEEAP